jgi:hypothetical protein
MASLVWCLYCKQPTDSVRHCNHCGLARGQQPPTSSNLRRLQAAPPKPIGLPSTSWHCLVSLTNASIIDQNILSSNQLTPLQRPTSKFPNLQPASPNLQTPNIISNNLQPTPSEPIPNIIQHPLSPNPNNAICHTPAAKSKSYTTEEKT